MIVGAIILTFLTGMIAGAGTMCFVQIRNMTTKLQIISRLWSHVTDLRLLQRGTGSKTLEDIEKEIDVTEKLCRPYADADDEEIFK